jgi:DNA polymerase
MLGARGLQSNLKNMFSIDKPLPFCEEIVKGYRRKNADIKSFWYSLGSASMKTVDSGQPHRAGPIVMHIKGDWLCMRLPSGRDVRYYKPEIVSGDYGPQIEYTSVNERGLPYRARTYAGKLTENAIQAICRDLLVESMSKLERLGYKVVFHVHDEVVLEVDDGFGSISEVEKVMCEVPDWAEGFPIGAEGFECKRYRK